MMEAESEAAFYIFQTALKIGGCKGLHCCQVIERVTSNWGNTSLPRNKVTLCGVADNHCQQNEPKVR